jgi:Type I phosphodiesterase / nucleotide pyrophosphatase
VLLVSVDGLHQSDLDWYVANHPGSELAKLAGGGNEYTSAQTPVPSDSDPGMTAQMTGYNPKTTGVFYDVEYNHALLPPGPPRATGRRRPTSSMTRRMTSTTTASTQARGSPGCRAAS